ncbi:MAG: hypothetical protein ABSF93_21790, partial [Candidatus Sulfotelmatobacter sp.]
MVNEGTGYPATRPAADTVSTFRHALVLAFGGRRSRRGTTLNCAQDIYLEGLGQNFADGLLQVPE